MRRVLNVLVDLATVAAAVAAVAVAISFVTADRRSILSQALREPRPVEGWEAIAAAGHRLGPDDAALTIVEFGDYECAACRRFHTVLEEFLSSNPEDVALVYRHWPLPQHLYAYDAALAAECAGRQGRFWEYHDQLYTDRNWLNDGFSRFARAAGVADLDAFSTCLTSGEAGHRIDSDIEAALAVGGAGTPTVIVNGILQPRPPSIQDLRTLLDAGGEG